MFRFGGIFIARDADADAQVRALVAGQLEFQSALRKLLGNLDPTEEISPFPSGIDHRAVKQVNFAVFGPLFAPRIDYDEGAAFRIGKGYFAIAVAIDVVGDFPIAIHIESDLVIISHTSDAVSVTARSPADPEVFTREMFSGGYRFGDLVQLPHPSVQRQQSADRFLVFFGLIAIKEPAAGFVDL